MSRENSGKGFFLPIASGFLLLIAPIANAAEELRAGDYDLDQDGALSKTEAITYFSHFGMYPHALIYDRDKDRRIDSGVIDHLSESERNAIAKSFESSVRKATDSYRQWTITESQPDGASLSFEQAETVAGIKKPQAGDKSRWVLADSARHLDLFDKDKTLARRNPAAFGYSANKLDSTRQATAKGALYWNSDLKQDKSGKHAAVNFSRYGFSATFNKVDASVKESETDSLALRATYVFNQSAGSGRLLYDTSVVHNTDSDFDSETNGIEFSLSPTNYSKLFGEKFDLCAGDHLVCRFANFEFQPSFNAVAAKVEEPAEGSGAEAGDEYFAVGADFELNIWPRIEPLDRANFNFKYTSYNGVSGDKGATDLWEVKASFPLDSGDRTALVLSYEDGEDLLQDKELRNVTLGLGVKF